MRTSFLHFRQIYKCKNKRMIINNREMYFKHCSTLIYELVTIHLGIKSYKSDRPAVKFAKNRLPALRNSGLTFTVRIPICVKISDKHEDLLH